MPKPVGMRKHLVTHEKDALYAIQHGAITKEDVRTIINQSGGRQDDVDWAAMGASRLVSLGYVRYDDAGYFTLTEKGRECRIPERRFIGRGGRCERVRGGMLRGFSVRYDIT